MAGERTTAGSALFVDSPPKQKDAPIVANLSAAGIVALGKTNLSEFAFSALGLNPHFGTPRNPARRRYASDRRRVVFGRGGCGCGRPCALRDRQRHRRLDPGAGLASAESSGSRRARGGSTSGRISAFAHPRHHRPARAYGRGLRADRHGAARAAGRSFAPPRSRRRRLHRARQVWNRRREPAVAANLEATMKRLAAAGAKVMSRPVPSIGAMRALIAQYGSLVAIEAYAEHRAIFDSADAERMDRRVVRRAMVAREISGEDAIKPAARAARDLIAALGDDLEGALLVLPSTPMTAPPIDALERDDELFRAHQSSRHPLYVSRQSVPDVRPRLAFGARTRRPAHRRPVPCARRATTIGCSRSG